jgi:hypothetical protein
LERVDERDAAQADRDVVGDSMPKLKTHRGAAKRFKKTGSGKIVRASASSATT